MADADRHIHSDVIHADHAVDIARDFKLDFRQKPLVARGLVNRGNMCFMNSILHPLLYCAPLYNFLKKVTAHVPHHFNSKTPLLDAL